MVRFHCIVVLRAILCAAINTGNDLPRRDEFDSLLPSSAIDEPPSDSGAGPNIPAPRTHITYLLTYLLIRLFRYDFIIMFSVARNRS